MKLKVQVNLTYQCVHLRCQFDSTLFYFQKILQRQLSLIRLSTLINQLNTFEFNKNLVNS